jgi:hypothetical protein
MSKKKKLSRTLDPQPRKRRAKFVMARPNDDIDAYGWSLKNVRTPTEDKDIAGRPVFHVPVSIEDIRRYGTEVQFLCPEYVQMQLDNCPSVTGALEKAKAASWTPEALKKLQDAVIKVFSEKVLVDVAGHFYAIAPVVAEFLAARAAHRDMFGHEDEEDEEETTAKPK